MRHFKSMYDHFCLLWLHRLCCQHCFMERQSTLTCPSWCMWPTRGGCWQQMRSTASSSACWAWVCPCGTRTAHWTWCRSPSMSAWNTLPARWGCLSPQDWDVQVEWWSFVLFNLQVEGNLSVTWRVTEYNYSSRNLRYLYLFLLFMLR